LKVPYADGRRDRFKGGKRDKKPTSKVSWTVSKLHNLFTIKESAVDVFYCLVIIANVAYVFGPTFDYGPSFRIVIRDDIHYGTYTSRNV